MEPSSFSNTRSVPTLVMDIYAQQGLKPSAFFVSPTKQQPPATSRGLIFLRLTHARAGAQAKAYEIRGRWMQAATSYACGTLQSASYT